MLPVFSNIYGFYALLGIPAVLAIHFLQHRSKKVNTSTLFLIDVLIPESRTGRVWEKIRNSLALWMQILCILMLTWVLVKPRWLQEDTWQTIVFVLDDSINMQAFKTAAVQAVERDMATVQSSRIPTHWVLMSSSSRKAPLYRGDDPGKMVAALEEWTPRSGEHDPLPALRTAQAVISGNGAARFITASKTHVPDWQAAIGVGAPLDNAGFAGLIPEEQAAEARWRVAVKNNSILPQERELVTRINEQASTQRIRLNPRSVTELKIQLPPAVNSMVLELSPDAFDRDDKLPIVRHIPKPLNIYLNAGEEQSAYFQKLVSTIPGARLSSEAGAHVRIVAADEESGMPGGPAIIFPTRFEKKETIPVVTAEPNALTRDLGWGGLLFAEKGTLKPRRPGSVLLWSGGEELAWLDDQALVLNWNWTTSNADRLPSTALLLRRYLETIQAGVKGYWSANVASNARLNLPGAAMMRVSPLSGEPYAKQYAGYMPDETGFVTVFADRDMKEAIFDGATYPPDARQGDFSQCSSFEQGSLAQDDILQKISTPDPFVPLWLAIAGGALMIAWIPGKREREQTRL